MTVSLRNQRAEVYDSLPSNDGGYLSQINEPSGRTYWCRLLELNAIERTLAGGPADTTVAQVEFDDAAVIPANGALLIEGTTYAIRGMTRRPMLRVLLVDVEAMPLPLEPDPVFPASDPGGSFGG